MKTLFLNPPSFEKFDGGAGSRWPATREIESYWYPVWLAYPAGMLPGSRLLDGPPHHITPAEVVSTSKDYDFVVLFTSTVGFNSDLRMARAMKEQKPDIKIAFVGPHVQIKPAESLLASSDLDFVVRGEFDHAVVEFAEGKPLSEIGNASYIKDGKGNSQSVAPADANRRTRCAAVCDRRIPEQFDDREIQRAVPAASLRFLLHGARMSGLVYFLPVAADAFGPCLAHALGRERCARIQAGAQDVPSGQGIFL